MGLHQGLQLRRRGFLAAQFTPGNVLSDQRSRLLWHDGAHERAAEPASVDLYSVVSFLVLFAWVVFDQAWRAHCSKPRASPIR
jgi:hypothetical protein